jgi:hypothetical protein
MKPTWKNDPKKYELMSKPFENEDEAKKALTAFMNDVSKLRTKHKIADILVVAKDSFKSPDDPEKIMEFMVHTQHGHAINGIVLSTYLNEKMKAQHNELIEKFKV